MLGRTIAIVVIVSGCAITADPSVLPGGEGIDVAIGPRAQGAGAPSDVCELAAQLPADDVCALLCDPAAMQDAMLAAGYRSGRCYELLCELPDSSHVNVGVCLKERPPGPIVPELAGAFTN